MAVPFVQSLDPVNVHRPCTVDVHPLYHTHNPGIDLSITSSIPGWSPRDERSCNAAMLSVKYFSVRAPKSVKPSEEIVMQERRDAG
jgi:hypothetical protein